MKKLLIAAAVAALVAAGCSSDTESEETPVPYIQASSTVDQTEGGVVLFDSNDGSEGITLSENAFLISEDGVYFVVAAPQVGGINGEGKAGCANFWIAVNGTNVDNSNVSWCSAQKADGDVIISQGALSLKSGDEVSVRWSTTGPNMEAIVAEGEPLVPSIIATIYRVG